jgi:uncharacterized cupredoxin-like copper-binding protein
MGARGESLELFVFAFGMLALALMGCDEESGHHSGAEVPHVSVVARDYGYRMPAEIPAGMVRMTLRNEGPEPHHAQPARLREGVTQERFNEELQRGPEAALPLLSFPGGPSVIGPGGTQEVTLNLAAGEYVMLCFVESPDGAPHLAKGMIQPFRVTGSVAAAEPPSTTSEATLRDFGFTLSDDTSGTATVKVTNAGPQVHEMVIVKPEDGKTLADVRAFLQEPQGPPPFAPAGGMQALDPGASGWLTLDLAPGTYIFLCNVPDPASGKPHTELGMIQAVTLQ